MKIYVDEGRGCAYFLDEEGDTSGVNEPVLLYAPLHGEDNLVDPDEIGEVDPCAIEESDRDFLSMLNDRWGTNFSVEGFTAMIPTKGDNDVKPCGDNFSMTPWRISNGLDMTSDEERLFWSCNLGRWVDRESADQFTTDERQTMTLPDGGIWAFFA